MGTVGYHLDMHRTVVLIHTLPDGSFHFDWLIDQPQVTTDRCLVSFRCHIRPDLSTSGAFTVEKLKDHREAYLTYEGVVSGGRGEVRRLAVGSVIEFEQTAHSISLMVQWSNSEGGQISKYEARKDKDKKAHWTFEREDLILPLDGRCILW